jgi:tRNA-dihydrouridine synthase
MSFWQDLPRPFFVLAPMEDVTDTVFRQIVTKVGKPDVFMTEFTHVDAILHHASMGRLIYSEAERPIVAQIWGTNPKSFYDAAQEIKRLKFDGIDINMGCPVRDIIKQGGCSALIGQKGLVTEIIQAVKEAGLPVSVKTRIGRKVIDTEAWIGFLLTQDLAAITIHGRTAAEMSKVPSHWDEIAKAVSLRNQSMSKTLIIGNGDVKDLNSARGYVQSAGVDGVMIGRGIFENVALFSGRILETSEKLDLLKEHLQLFYSTWGSTKDMQIMKKFVKIYVNGFEGAAEIRQNVMNMIS